LILEKGNKNYYFIRYKHISILDTRLYFIGDVEKQEEEISTVIDIHPFEWLLIKTAEDEKCLNQYMLIDFKVISKHRYNLFKEYERCYEKYVWC